MSTKKTTVEETQDQAAMLRAEVEAIMQAAREEAARIIESAKEAVASENHSTARQTLKTNPELEELVPVMLFKDSDKYKDDVFVAVNGEACLIQRGKPVHIKKKFALVLEQSQVQDMATADMIAGLTREYKTKETRLAE